MCSACTFIGFAMLSHPVLSPNLAIPRPFLQLHVRHHHSGCGLLASPMPRDCDILCRYPHTYSYSYSHSYSYSYSYFYSYPYSFPYSYSYPYPYSYPYSYSYSYFLLLPLPPISSLMLTNHSYH